MLSLSLSLDHILLSLNPFSLLFLLCPSPARHSQRVVWASRESNVEVSSLVFLPLSYYCTLPISLPSLVFLPSSYSYLFFLLIIFYPPPCFFIFALLLRATHQRCLSSLVSSLCYSHSLIISPHHILLSYSSFPPRH